MSTVRPMLTGQLIQLPAPPPITRPLLQQSVHARGARPYTFGGVIDEYHAPGVVYKNGDTKCAVDAAWLTGAVLGPARVTPHAWPGVPQARANALTYGKSIGARDYQCEGGAFLAERDYGLLFDQMGIGKAQPLTAKILTPAGWKTMGSMQVGDEIVNSAGTVSRVIGVYPQGERDVFRVVLNDGSSTECCDEHLWAVSTPSRRFEGRTPKVVSLKDLRAAPLCYPSGNRKHFLPLLAPVEAFTSCEDLPVDPYVLGQLLGDGGLTQSSVHLTTADQETVDRVGARLPNGLRMSPTGGKYGWTLASAGAGVHNPLIASLRRLELMGLYSHEKFIPHVYKWGSREVRTAVLQGLLDSDGYATPYNGIEYSSSSKRLAMDVVHLVQSLGGSARVKEKPTTHLLSYRMSIALPSDVVPFLLRRKALVYRPRTKYPPHRAIVEIVPIGRKDVQCIAVDSADHLYVTDDFILTHNTIEALVAAEARLALGVIPTPETPVVLILCPALAKRHWQREVKKWTKHESVVLDTLRPDPEQLAARYVIANYDILYGQQKKDAAGVLHARKDLPGWGETLRGRFLIVIADEAHILRGRSSKRTDAVRNLTAGVPVVWGLTGTPMPNYVRDLWATIDVITGGLHGKYYPWARAYCNGFDGQYGFDDKGTSRIDELRGRLTFFALGRTKDSVGLELPPMLREVYKVDVEVSAPTVYEGRQAIERQTAVASAFRATARAKRSVVIAHAVEALESAQKVIVFLYMREQCDAVAKAIKDKWDGLVLCVHGDMSPEGRDKMAQTFRETQDPACFVATIDSVGIAISLVGADLMLFGDVVAEPWKLLQAEKRGHRFDSKKSLLVRYLIATGTIDEGLAEAVIDKLAALDETIGAQGENQNLSTVLGARSSAEIVDELFSKLKAWSAGGEE